MITLAPLIHADVCTGSSFAAESPETANTGAAPSAVKDFKMATYSRRAVRRLSMVALALSFSAWAGVTFSAPGAPRDMEVTFGKHAGKMMSEIVEEDPGWCQWATRTAEAEGGRDRLQRVTEWLKKNAPEVMEMPPTVNFGKHKGLTVSQLVEEDPGYCEWILRTAETGDPGPALADVAAYIQKHHPKFQA